MQFLFINKLIKINNINDYKGKACSCSSTLEHWKKASKEPVFYCSEQGCLRTDLIGAYVQKNTNTNQWYIVPLCKMHSRANRGLDVPEHTLFVKIEENQNCGIET